MFRYILIPLNHSLGKHVNCEVCHKPVLSTMYYQKEQQDYKHGWTSAYCTDYSGHIECLESKQKKPKYSVKIYK